MSDVLLMEVRAEMAAEYLFVVLVVTPAAHPATTNCASKKVPLTRLGVFPEVPSSLERWKFDDMNSCKLVLTDTVWMYRARAVYYCRIDEGVITAMSVFLATKQATRCTHCRQYCNDLCLFSHAILSRASHCSCRSVCSLAVAVSLSILILTSFPVSHVVWDLVVLKDLALLQS